MTTDARFLPVQTPDAAAPRDFTDAAAAVAHLRALYDQATGFLLGHFTAILEGTSPSRAIAPSTPRCG